MATTVFVLNGPNLNLLGQREPAIYGSQTLAGIQAMLETRARVHELAVDFRQSNHEGVLVDWLHEALAGASAVIINAGGYSHSSVAIRDAVSALSVPVIEVHLSNIHAREAFRHHSMIAGVARGSIVGLGAAGYVLALDAAAQLCKGSADAAIAQVQQGKQ